MIIVLYLCYVFITLFLTAAPVLSFQNKIHIVSNYSFPAAANLLIKIQQSQVKFGIFYHYGAPSFQLVACKCN